MKTPWWFLSKNPFSLLLWPVSVLYGVGSRTVYNIRRIGAYESRRSIVCIGNIFAGGVGKTPIVRAVAGYFDAPVVMRGYKNTAKTNNIGDEALMLARAGLQVHTGNRRSNIKLLDAQRYDKSPIIMDDGFQNPRIKKTVSVLVFDARLGVGNGFLLPAGPLREGCRAIKRADAVIVIKAPHGVRGRDIKIPDNIPVFYAENKTVSPYKKGARLFAFAGIGYPKKFFSSLDNIIGKKSFPDHYQYTDEDIAALRVRAKKLKAHLITTEKDWVRLPADVQNEIKYAELQTVIDEKFFIWLKEKLNANNKKRN